MARKVEPAVDAGIERDAGRNVSPVAVAIEMDDGRILQARVDTPLGHPQRPMSRADSEAKARDCFELAARPLPSEAVGRLRDHVDRIEHLEDTSQLAGCLSSPA